MAFSTHKYTRPVLVAELRKLNASNFSNIQSLATALSPRVGRKGAKFAALKKYVNLNKVIGGSTGAVAKLNIISALTLK